MGHFREATIVDSTAEVSASLTIPSTRFLPQSPEQLLTATPEQIASCDTALMNLVCAMSLPGAEDMDIPKSMTRLRNMAEYIRGKTEQELPWFRLDSRRANLAPGTPEDFFRVASLIRNMKDTFGLHYNRELVELKQNNTGTRFAQLNSKDMLINGLLSDERSGTCNSIPIIVVALGRRLGYPLYVTCNRFHVWARWDGNGKRFNIDAASPGNSFGDSNDEHYRTFPQPWHEIDKQANYYLKNFTATDELALYLMSRAWVLRDNLRFEESIPYWAKACHLAPGEPQYPSRGFDALTEAILLKKNGRVARWGGKSLKRRRRIDKFDHCNLFDLFPNATVAQAFSITAHYHEVHGQIGAARKYYQYAVETEPNNPDYQADLRRYRHRSHKDLVRAHVRNTEFVRKNIPGAKVPPLRQSVRQFKKSLTVEVPAGTLPPDGILTAIALQQQMFGLQAMDAGKWATAQAHFAKGYFVAGEDDKRFYKIYLGNAIRKELLGVAPLKPAPPRAESDDDDEEDESPISNPRPHMQGFIWHARGSVLVGLGRLIEAEQAFSEAVKLSPTNGEYQNHQKQTAELIAKQKAQSEPKAILTYTGNRLPYPGTYVTTPEAAFCVRDGSALPPVVISPPHLLNHPIEGKQNGL